MTTKYDNSGALFKNDRKEKDSHPDYNGSITVQGVDYWLNGWLKDGKKGKFFSLSVKVKDKQGDGFPDERPARGARPDNDIPFR